MCKPTHTKVHILNELEPEIVEALEEICEETGQTIDSVLLTHPTSSALRTFALSHLRQNFPGLEEENTPFSGQRLKEALDAVRSMKRKS